MADIITVAIVAVYFLVLLGIGAWGSSQNPHDGGLYCCGAIAGVLGFHYSDGGVYL